MVTQLEWYYQGLKVPKHTAYQFYKQIVIPSLNYACFSDSTEAKINYERIDAKLIDFVKILFQ